MNVEEPDLDEVARLILADRPEIAGARALKVAMEADTGVEVSGAQAVRLFYRHRPRITVDITADISRLTDKRRLPAPEEDR